MKHIFDGGRSAILLLVVLLFAPILRPIIFSPSVLAAFDQIDFSRLLPGGDESPSNPAPAERGRVPAITGSESQYMNMVYEIVASQGHQVEPELVMGIIQQESNWNATAVSSANAKGLMQLMPGTASDMGVSDPFNPYQNITGGVKYITWLLRRYNGDQERAVQAYHAGPGNIESRGPSELDRYYSQRVLGFYEDYKARASVGSLRPYGVGTEQIGPIYETATLTQGHHEDKAVDLAAGGGTPIFSPITGEIVAKYVDGLGNTVIKIENDFWLITLLHGDYLPEVGDEISQGDIIGYEDNFGNTRSGGVACFGRDGCGEHTHITIRDKSLGYNVDPLKFTLARTLYR